MRSKQGEMTRRVFLRRAPLAMLMPAGILSINPVRVFQAREVGLGVEEELVEGGVTEWRFQHINFAADPLSGALPAAGERVYFDGREWGGPVIDGEVWRVEQEMHPGLSWLTVRGKEGGS